MAYLELRQLNAEIAELEYWPHRHASVHKNWFLSRPVFKQVRHNCRMRPRISFISCDAVAAERFQMQFTNANPIR